VLRITNAGKTARGCRKADRTHRVLAYPRRCRAVQDGIAVQLMDLEETGDRATRSRTPLPGLRHPVRPASDSRGKLPATDLPAEQTLFGHLETQFSKVSDLRDDLHNLAVPPVFTLQTDAQRLIVYCNAVTAWRLTADTETGNETFEQLTSRKAAMAHRLQTSGAAADCAPVMSTQTTPPM
jgi:hypothetical protein